MSDVATFFSPTVLWIIFAVAFFIWGVYSWMFTYHWHSYGKHTTAMKHTALVYFTGSIIIFIIISILIATL